MKSHNRIAKPSLADYLAVMSRAVFQAGLSWAAIDRQWEPLRKAFDDFDVKKVSRYRTPDINRIMTSPGILHSKRKIQATIKNAATILALDKECKGFRNYLRSLGSYEELTVDLKKRFSFVGDISAYYFLYRVGEPVPPFSKWIKTVEGDHPRIREMVAETKPRTSKK
ncbi:MAG TPA: DNA-3-methyladenine glycosylase I [Candidatus Eremiobacteraceae bacterium]